ncbi:MAG: hypothetical protein LBM68_03450 [Bacteroidales bacterium]|jgi:hypothetical protein|nr:hypothetical protein [Bacteroidales bacterium]
MRKILSYLLVTLCFTLFITVGFSQSKKQFFDAYKAAGDSALAEHNYFGAHQAFAKALEFEQNAEVAYNCAEACRSYQNYTDAEKYYRMTNSLDSVTYRLASFWIADLLKMRAQYDDAAFAFDQFYMANRQYNDYFTVRAQQESIICSSNVKNIPTQDIKQHRIDEKKINTMYSEYAPVQYNDSLFFYGAVHPKDAQLADTSLVFSNYTTKLSRAYVRDSVWQTPAIVDSLNDTAMLANNLTFSSDGKTAYFSKCAGYNCALYRAQFDAEKEQFSDIEKLPSRINMQNTSNTTPHLAVTPQGEVLFWSSDRKDGKGGFDIWYARINQANNSFENPRNCGTNINTPGNEVTPFYDARDSLLYFSSEWHAGLGGLDIFTSKVDMRNNKFAKASNIGKPVNSSYNDLYYSYSRDSLRAYWVSNREESTKLLGVAHANDIYYHTLAKKTINRIADLIPITLYFDNDFPNPRSKDSTTTDVYSQLFSDYMLQRNNFVYGYTQYSSVESFSEDVRDVDAFFKDAREQYNNLELFSQLVNILCNDGLDIVIALKGYASPVGFTDYNEVLAKRRISCLQNYFNEYNGGALAKFTQNEPNTGKGSVKFIQEPIGSLTDEAIMPNASEQERLALSDRGQRWKSVYSPTASYQRKIEIVAVSFEEEENLMNEIESEIKVNKRPVEDELNSVKQQKVRQSVPVSRDFTEEPEYTLDETVEFNHEGTPTPAVQPQQVEQATDTIPDTSIDTTIDTTAAPKEIEMFEKIETFEEIESYENFEEEDIEIIETTETVELETSAEKPTQQTQVETNFMQIRVQQELPAETAEEATEEATLSTDEEKQPEVNTQPYSTQIQVSEETAQKIEEATNQQSQPAVEEEEGIYDEYDIEDEQILTQEAETTPTPAAEVKPEPAPESKQTTSQADATDEEEEEYIELDFEEYEE